MTKISIMLDLETWGKKPGSDIRSIGACVFDPAIGVALDFRDGTIDGARPNQGETFYIATENPVIESNEWSDPATGGTKTIDVRKYPLTRDPSTVQWWSEQTDEAQAAFTDPVDLRVALIRFGDWLRALANDHYGASGDPRYPDDLCLWSHGPAFDIAILAACYDACDLPVPWHYRAPRDTRTAFDMAGVRDHSQWMQQFNHGTVHHALDDAISQAKAVCGAYARLGAQVVDAAKTIASRQGKSIAANVDQLREMISNGDVEIRTKAFDDGKLRPILGDPI